MKKKTEYFELLKDPRWQKKRLEILERDNWCCRRCFDDENQLSVHHLFYIKDLDPWDYSNDTLITLCDSCHKIEKDSYYISLRKLQSILVHKTYLSDEIFKLAEVLRTFNMAYPPEVQITFLEWLFGKKKLMEELENLYWAYILKQAKDKKNESKNH